MCNGQHKPSRWNDAVEAKIDCYLDFVSQWPELQRLDIGFGPEGHHDAKGFDANARRLYAKYKKRRVGLINDMGIIGLQLKRDSWHALTTEDLGRRFARDLACTLVAGWNVYYFILTLSDALVNNGHLSPSLFGQVQQHFDVNLINNEELNQTSVAIVHALVVRMTSQLEEKCRKRRALIGKPNQPGQGKIPLDDLVSTPVAPAGLRHSPQSPASAVDSEHSSQGSKDQSSKIVPPVPSGDPPPVPMDVDPNDEDDTNDAAFLENIGFTFSQPWVNWFHNFVNDENNALAYIELGKHRYTRNCSCIDVFMKHILAEYYELFTNDPSPTGFGILWQAIPVEERASMSPFGGEFTRKGIIKVTFSRPFEFNFGDVYQPLAPCNYECLMPTNHLGGCHELVVAINPHFHPDDSPIPPADKRHWAYAHNYPWKLCVLGKLAHPHPLTKCSQSALYMKGDFVSVPLCTDRHIMALPIGHSTEGITSFLEQISEKKLVGSGFNMEEIASQLDKSYHFKLREPEEDDRYVLSKLCSTGNYGPAHPDAEGYLFSCGSFQSHPFNSPLIPDECDAEDLAERPRVNGSFVYRVPLEAIEQDCRC